MITVTLGIIAGLIVLAVGLALARTAARELAGPLTMPGRPDLVGYVHACDAISYHRGGGGTLYCTWCKAVDDEWRPLLIGGRP